MLKAGSLMHSHQTGWLRQAFIRLLAAAAILFIIPVFSGCSGSGAMPEKALPERPAAGDTRADLVRLLSDQVYTVAQKHESHVSPNKISDWLTRELNGLDNGFFQGETGDFQTSVQLVLGDPAPSASDLPAGAGKSGAGVQKRFISSLDEFKIGQQSRSEWWIVASLSSRHGEAGLNSHSGPGETAEPNPARGEYAIASYNNMPEFPIVDPVSLDIGIQKSIPFTFDAPSEKGMVYLETLLLDGWTITQYNGDLKYKDYYLTKSDAVARVIILKEYFKVFMI